MAITENNATADFDTQKAISVVEALLRQHRYFLYDTITRPVVPTSEFPELLSKINIERDLMNERIPALATQYGIAEDVYKKKLDVLNDMYTTLTGGEGLGPYILCEPYDPVLRGKQQTKLLSAGISHYTPKDRALVEEMYPTKKTTPFSRDALDATTTHWSSGLKKGLAGIFARKNAAAAHADPNIPQISKDKPSVYTQFPRRQKPKNPEHITLESARKDSHRDIMARRIQEATIREHEQRLYAYLDPKIKVQSSDLDYTITCIADSRDDLMDIMEKTGRFCNSPDAEAGRALEKVLEVYDALTAEQGASILEQSSPLREELRSKLSAKSANGFLSEEEYLIATDKFLREVDLLNQNPSGNTPKPWQSAESTNDEPKAWRTDTQRTSLAGFLQRETISHHEKLLYRALNFHELCRTNPSAIRIGYETFKSIMEMTDEYRPQQSDAIRKRWDKVKEIYCKLGAEDVTPTPITEDYALKLRSELPPEAANGIANSKIYEATLRRFSTEAGRPER